MAETELKYIGPFKAKQSKFNFLSDDISDLQKIWECKSCLRIPLDPIRVCQAMHIFCNYCFPGDLRICLICQEPFSEKNAKLISETMDKKSFRCIYRKEGCKADIPNEDFNQHISECTYKEINCILCPEKHFISKLLTHMIREHALTGAMNSKVNDYVTCFTFNSNELNQTNSITKFGHPIYLTYKTGVQFVQVKIFDKNSFFTWVYIFDQEEKTKKYCCEIEMSRTKQMNNMSHKLVFENAPIHSINKPIDQIFLSGKYCQVSQEDIVKYSKIIAKTEDVVHYTLYIHCKIWPSNTDKGEIWAPQ